MANICRDANERMDQAKKAEELKVLLGVSDNMRTVELPLKASIDSTLRVLLLSW